MRAGRRRLASHPTREDSPGFWLCTAGTSGRPKLAMHRQADLRLAAEGYPREVLGLGPGDRCLSLVPLWHAYGLGNSLAFPLAAGATAILELDAHSSPSLVAKLVRDEQPTLLFGMPAAYAELLASGLPPQAFGPVRHAASAGERLPAEVATGFRERFGLELLDGVGSTELLQVYLSNRPGSSRPGTVGRPVAGYRVRLEAADGVPVPPGTPGRLHVSGATMASGYWCRASATRQAFRGEWFDSGDMYVCSGDGVYTYLGRADEMFEVAGEWVAPADVEAVLVEHAAVSEAVVVGEERADGMVEPVAYVVAEPGVTVDPAVLLAHCRRRLPGAQRPRRIVVIASRCRARGWARCSARGSPTTPVCGSPARSSGGCATAGAGCGAGRGAQGARVTRRSTRPPDASRPASGGGRAGPRQRPVGGAERGVRGAEARAPGGMAWRPAELAPGLRVVGAASLREHPPDRGLARERPREPGRKQPRRLRAQGLREHRQPLAHRRGVVVDDVVDRRHRRVRARRPSRRRRRRGGSHDEMPPPSPTSGKPPLANSSTSCLRRARPVEVAVARRDASERRARTASSR